MAHRTRSLAPRWKMLVWQRGSQCVILMCMYVWIKYIAYDKVFIVNESLNLWNTWRTGGGLSCPGLCSSCYDITNKHVEKTCIGRAHVERTWLTGITAGQSLAEPSFSSTLRTWNHALMKSLPLLHTLGPVCAALPSHNPLPDKVLLLSHLTLTGLTCSGILYI